jgi:hypothetical protein
MGVGLVVLHGCWGSSFVLKPCGDLPSGMRLAPAELQAASDTQGCVLMHSTIVC